MSCGIVLIQLSNGRAGTAGWQRTFPGGHRCDQLQVDTIKFLVCLMFRGQLWGQSCSVLALAFMLHLHSLLTLQ